MKARAAVVGVLLGVGLAGCLTPRPCSSDTDCEGGGRCEPTYGFCVSDGVDGGAAGGGAGGGAVGGGGGGAAQGGGGGGGVVSSCVPACDTPLTCDEERHACSSPFVLSFLSPDAGLELNLAGPSSLDFLVSLTRVDGGVEGLPSDVSFWVPAVASAQTPAPMERVDAGLFRAQLQLPDEELVLMAYAGWPGSLQASRSLTLDRVAPTLTLELAAAPLPGGRFFRDSDFPLVVHSTERLVASSFEVATVGTDDAGLAQDTSVADTVCLDGGLTRIDLTDRCALVHLSDVPFETLEGVVELSARGEDRAGNPATVTQALDVTRQRWTLGLLGTGTLSATAAPALDAQGNLLVGVSDSSALSGGQLFSLSPSGAVNWSVPLGRVVSVAVATTAVGDGGLEEYVFVTSNGVQADGGLQGRLDVLRSDGGSGPSSAALTDVRSTSVALALFDAGALFDGGVSVGAVSVFNVSGTATSGTLRSWSSLQGARLATGGVTTAAPVPNMKVRSPVNVVASNGRAFFQQANRSLGSITLTPTLASGLDVAAVQQGRGAGLALGGNVLYSAWAATTVTMGVTSPLLWSTFGATIGPSAPQAGNLTSPLPDSAWAPLVLTNVVVAPMSGTATDWLETVSLTGAGPPFAAAESLGAGAFSAAPLSVSPVLGAGGGQGALLYAVLDDGTLTVFDATQTNGVAGKVHRWSAPLFPSARVSAHPTLDCSRTSPGTQRPGTLYVVSEDGQVAAVIVDSTRLARQAPWPKWQRTAGNAGNPDFELNPGCPGP